MQIIGLLGIITCHPWPYPVPAYPFACNLHSSTLCSSFPLQPVMCFPSLLTQLSWSKSNFTFPAKLFLSLAFPKGTINHSWCCDSTMGFSGCFKNFHIVFYFIIYISVSLMSKQFFFPSVKITIVSHWPGDFLKVMVICLQRSLGKE